VGKGVDEGLAVTVGLGNTVGETSTAVGVSKVIQEVIVNAGTNNRIIHVDLISLSS